MSADDVIKAHVKALKEGRSVLKLIRDNAQKPGWGEQAGQQRYSNTGVMLCPRENVFPCRRCAARDMTPAF